MVKMTKLQQQLNDLSRKELGWPQVPDSRSYREWSKQLYPSAVLQIRKGGGPKGFTLETIGFQVDVGDLLMFRVKELFASTRWPARRSGQAGFATNFDGDVSAQTGHALQLTTAEFYYLILQNTVSGHLTHMYNDKSTVAVSISSTQVDSWGVPKISLREGKGYSAVPAKVIVHARNEGMKNGPVYMVEEGYLPFVMKAMRGKVPRESIVPRG